MRNKISTFSKTLFVLILISFIGCKPTRFIEEGDYLLQKNTVAMEESEVDKKILESYYRQKPNKKFLLFFKFNLAAYNFSQRGKQRKWKSWVGRVVGEEPVVFDSLLVDKTVQQFERFLMNESYYRAEVKSTVKYSKKKAWVNYKVKLNEPMRIEHLEYNILDSSLTEIIISDTLNSTLREGKLFALKHLQNERNRISIQLKDSGYYYFNNDYINYDVDTSGYSADIKVNVQQALKKIEGTSYIREPHRKVWIDKVYFYPDFDPHKAISDRKLYFSTFDTVNYKGFYFVYPGFHNVKPKTILKAGDLEPGQLYSFSDVNSTTRYINSLRLFRLNNISFTKNKLCDSLLNCHVQLTPFTYQNYSVNFETTNTGGNIGIGGSFKYTNKNLFRGAEIFRVKLMGSNQFVTKTKELEAFNILEVGAEMGLDIPSFLMPFKSEKFYKKYNPKTTFSAAANYQLRPDYNRLIYSTSMGYVWYGSKDLQNIITPVDLSTVKVDATDAFRDSIKGTYLENNYKDYFIAGGRYSMIFKNKRSAIKGNYTFFRWNAEVAGNLFYLLDNTMGMRDTVQGGYYSVLGLQYAQFAKTDIDYRYYQGFGKKNSLVYRFFGGIAIPYGNAKATPFIRQYYAGGAEGMRAWQVKSLGPGTFVQPDSVYPNQTSDIKIEANIEHRYTIIGSLKGATFIDIGNIWAISEEDDRPGSVFKFKEFYNQFAIGTGLGVRYDIRFAVIRLDLGIKVRDPSLPGADGWLLFNRPFHTSHINWNFAIGYPF